MGSMIFWRLIIFSWQKDGKFSYMLILCLGSFLSIAHFNVYNFTCNLWCMLHKNGAFFLHGSLPEKEIVIFSRMSLGTYSVPFFSFLKLGNYFLSIKPL